MHAVHSHMTSSRDQHYVDGYGSQSHQGHGLHRSSLFDLTRHGVTITPIHPHAGNSCSNAELDMPAPNSPASSAAGYALDLSLPWAAAGGSTNSSG